MLCFLSAYCFFVGKVPHIAILGNDIWKVKKNNTAKFLPNPSLKLMDQVREVLRYHHYAYRTEQTYCQWILRYISFFGGKTHPNKLAAKDVERFLPHLVTEGKVAASTQRQALNALVFLYREVLDRPLDDDIAPIRSKQQQKPPTVLVKAEVQALLGAMTGKPCTDGQAPVWRWSAIARVYPPAHAGC